MSLMKDSTTLLVISITVILTMLAGCTQTSPAIPLPANGTTNPVTAQPLSIAHQTVQSTNNPYLYSNSSMGFQIKYPEGWVVNESFGINKINIRNPVDGTNLVALIITNQNYPLNQYIPSLSNALLKNRDFVIDQKPSTLDGIPAETLIVKTNGTKEVVVVAINNNTAYIIVLGSRDSLFDQYNDIFNSMIQSFQFK
jgi:hypothetical protein